MPKILFIQATQYSEDGSGLLKQKRLYLPGLAFALLSALTPKHWQVEVCLEVIEDVPFDIDADIIGIGAMGQAVLRAKDIAREFKRRGKTVVMGGYMPSLVPEFVDDVSDSVIIGDAEISYPKMLQDFEAGCLQKRYHYPVNDLGGLPLPRYELLTNKRISYMLPVQAGRGCPHACSYCSIYCLYRKKYLTRPLEEVMRDIRQVRSLGYRAFFLLDDNLMGNPAYFEQLCEQVKPLGMVWATQSSILLARNSRLLKLAAESGCRILSLGIESISQEGLNKANKQWVHAADHETMLARIANAGIMPATEMMVGLEGDTEESLRATADFVVRSKIPIPKFYMMTPMPGTDLYKQYKAEGRLLHEDYSRYTATDAVFRHDKLSPEKLEELYWYIYKKVYSIPNILRRTVLHRQFLRRPLSYLFALFVNFKYLRFIRAGNAPNIL